MNNWSVSKQVSSTALVTTVYTKTALTSDKISCLLSKERATVIYSVEQGRKAMVAVTKAIKINKSDSTIPK